MDDKLKVFWNLDILVKMCRSKNDGPSLRIEEVELLEKIKSHNQEIEEINALTEEESYDTSAEMADRNIEIITKKQLQVLKSSLKEKVHQLDELKEEEAKLYASNSLLKDTKASQEKYIISMQERVGEATNYEVIDRYNALIAETTEKATLLSDEIEEESNRYEDVQKAIIEVADEIATIEEKIEKKKNLLEETIKNLETKENYIDKTKKEKNEKKIADLNSKIDKLTKRLLELRKDPKYLESKIKDVINNNEPLENAKDYLLDLINVAIKVPYINVPTDKALDEELLKATQARDSFANEIDQKSYNILEADTPEKLRIEFLADRIEKWNSELNTLKARVDIIDKDEEYHYEEKNQKLYDMINTMKIDLKEFQRAYDETPDSSISYKASLKAQLNEKSSDIVEAEKIATLFRKDESDDIAKATKTLKYECDQIAKNIASAESEINDIKSRLTTKKAGLIDITNKNKDKDTLKELAQTVIDIKHRRQFAETPIEVIKRIEAELGIGLLSEIDTTIIENNSNIVSKNYEEFTKPDPIQTVEVPVEATVSSVINESTPKRGIKVIEEAEISTNLEGLGINKVEEEIKEEKSNIEEITEHVENHTEESTQTITEPETEAVPEPEIENTISEIEITSEASTESNKENQIPQEEKNEISEEAIEKNIYEEEPLDISEIIEATKEPETEPDSEEKTANDMGEVDNQELSEDELINEIEKYVSRFNQDNN